MTDNIDMSSRLGMALRWLGLSVIFLSWLDLMFGSEPVPVRRDITFFGLGIVIGITGDFLLRRGRARRMLVVVLILLVVAWTALVLSHLPD